MRLASPAAVLLLLLAACADPAGPEMTPALADEAALTPSASATSSRIVVTVTLDGVQTPNMCGGEDIFLTGEITYTEHLVTDGTDATHSTIHQQGHVKGETASGVRYQAILNEHLTSELPGVCNTAEDCTQTALIKLVGQGGAPDLTMRSLTHFSHDADGDLVANVQRFETVGR
jgi:hypothetical protein